MKCTNTNLCPAHNRDNVIGLFISIITARWPNVYQVLMQLNDSKYAPAMLHFTADEFERRHFYETLLVKVLQELTVYTMDELELQFNESGLLRVMLTAGRLEVFLENNIIISEELNILLAELVRVYLTTDKQLANLAHTDVPDNAINHGRCH